MIRRREVVAAPLAMAAWAGASAADAPGSAGAKVLRYAFVAAETSFDPARVNDLYSRIVLTHVLEAPLRFDYLARPFKVVPHTAAAMPEIGDDYKTWTVRIRSGVYFADDPAFKGKPRELTAADYVYSIKRFFDPVNRTPNSSLREAGILGLNALGDETVRSKHPFDYDREVEGLRAIDRYTLQFRFAAPRPRFAYLLADSSLYGAVAREVIELYGDRSGEHPVGTGAFQLAEWRRSSKIALNRNPTYREVRYDGEPAAGDSEGEALLRRFKGRKLPMIDRVEVSIIEESQPRWLSFLRGDLDLLMAVPLEFASQAAPGGKLAPYLSKRGVQMDRFVNPDRTLYYFNMEDPVVGGMTADKVALRRAISLATNVDSEIENVRRGQAVRAQSVVAPGTWGYDPAYASENGIFDLARAKALLDLYGYVDRDGDGWRELPDGKPLLIEYASEPTAIDRQFDELWKKNMDALGVRLTVKLAQWPEQLKAARAGQLMIWQLGYTATDPDVQDGLQILYGPASGGQNLARFKEPRFDELYRKMQALPDGPERLAALREALKILVAYAPQKINVHRIVTWLMQPCVIGMRPPLFSNQFWQHIDIDNSKRGSAST